MSKKTAELTVAEVLEKLPQRYPFLMIDKIIEKNNNEYIKALKNVTSNEPYFPGHFPQKAIMPGVVIIEALAQTTIFFFNIIGEYYLTSIKVRFLSPVIPGDQLILESEPVKLLSDAGIFKVKASVSGKIVARGEIGVRLKVKENE